MKKYKIYAGLDGGFGGAEYIGTYEFRNEREALEFAEAEACDTFERYAGMYGLPDYGELCEEFAEDGLDNPEDAAWEVYVDERNSWLDYYVEKVKGEQ